MNQPPNIRFLALPNLFIEHGRIDRYLPALLPTRRLHPDVGMRSDDAQRPGLVGRHAPDRRRRHWGMLAEYSGNVVGFAQAQRSTRPTLHWARGVGGRHKAEAYVIPPAPTLFASLDGLQCRQ